MLFIIITLILSLLFFQYNSNIIVLPFRKNNPSTSLEEFYTKELFTEVSVGDPPQTLNININADSFIFYIQPGLCYHSSPSFYNYSKSKTFHMETSALIDCFDEYADGAYARDIFTFYNSTNLQTNITQKGFEFYFSSYISYKVFKNVCGIIGLGLKDKKTNYIYNLDSFLKSLKTKGLINDYSWTYLFFEKEDSKIFNLFNITNQYIMDNYNGLLILGNYTNENNPNNNYKDTNENSYLQILAAETNKTLKWSLVFGKIYCKYKEEISIKKDIYADLSIDYDYIISTKEYFEKLIYPFFNSYLKKQICKINEVKKNGFMYQVISCDKTLFTIKDIKQFSTIYFFHRELNFTFELRNEELFHEINNTIFFCILKNVGKYNEDTWKLGKIFLRKYHFGFNQDSKTIRFYNKMEIYNQFKKGNNNGNLKNNINLKFNKNIIWIIVCVFCLIMGIYIGNKIIIRNKKMRANELQDEYEYKVENVNNNKKNNFLGEKNIEMGIKGLLI